MKSKSFIPILLLAYVMLATAACNKFVVENVNYSQQIESVLIPDENGDVNDIRHGITFNIEPFKIQEFGEEDTTPEIKEVRLIRNAEGYYFITANQFKNVYVMEPGKSELKLKNKIQVSEERLNAPAFNLRDKAVQLVKTDTNEILTLNENGLQESKEEDQS
ncbi:hypothetical protein [Gracilimonas halophila]|jgi:hypothetical protein|uniref:Uncharacterized protein n=1 Tax=Gracilimonas halophila TaxID=1834464 RepID=A0ABW5JHQ9_9BACT